MKRWFALPLFVIAVLLSGCTTPTIRSEVTVFHEWPVNLAEKTFVFERTAEQDNDLEYRSYENLVRNELTRLGFTIATSAQIATLKVTLHYGMEMRDLKVVQPVVVDRYWPGGRFYGSRWSGYHSPFYNPLWYSVPDIEYQETTFQVFNRELNIVIAQRVNGKKLFDVTVNSEGTIGSFATVIPYMIRSAFVDFPGKSGVPRRIELQLQDGHSNSTAK